MRAYRHRLAPEEINHELLWLLVSLGAALGLALWLSTPLPRPRCVFHSLTGLPCLTCGATRSARQFMHGHFVAAFLFNPLAFLTYCAIALFDLYAFVVLLDRAPRIRFEALSVGEKRFLRWAAVFLLAANWIYLLVGHFLGRYAG